MKRCLISEMEDHIFEDRDSLVKDLLQMLERGSSNDVKIKLIDGEITANKDMLMARSKYFASKFTEEGGTLAADMSDLTGKFIMRKIIGFLYSGSLQFGDLFMDGLFSLLHMSELLLQDKLKAQVDNYIKATLRKQPETEDHFFEDRDSLVEDLLGMLEKGSLNDVKIKLSDGEITANKHILRARSEYFSTHLPGKAGGTGVVHMSHIIHCSKAIMDKITEFLFSGSLQLGDLSMDQLLKVCHMSVILKLDKVKAQVDNYIREDRVKTLLKQPIKTLKIIEDTDLFNSTLRSGDRAFTHNFCTIVPLVGDRVMVGNHNMRRARAVRCPGSFNLIKDIFVLRAEWTYQPTSIKIVEATWISPNEATEEQKKQIDRSFDLVDFTVGDLMSTIKESGLFLWSLRVRVHDQEPSSQGKGLLKLRHKRKREA